MPGRSSEQEESDSGLPLIAVVVPAYRAAATIQVVLAGIPNFVAHIVVVDDCSPDNTADLVLAYNDPRVHLIYHRENQGVGGAVLSGYDAAVRLGAEIIVKMDSDGQMDPEYMLSLLRPILKGEADYVKGNRFLHARQLRSMPFIRRIGNAGLSFLTKLASGYWNMFDPTNGYTAIHNSVVRMLDRTMIDERYFFETSMLLELSMLRGVVRDVYVPARYGDEASSLSEFDALVRFPGRLLKGFLRRLATQYFLRDFSAFSVFLAAAVPLTLFGIVWGAYHWYSSAKMGVDACTGTGMSAAIPIIMGIQLLLQAVVLDIQNVPVNPIHIASAPGAEAMSVAPGPVARLGRG